MIDLAVEYWNDALTLLVAAVTIVLGFYQIQDYRAQQAEIRILEVKKPKYGQASSTFGFDDTPRPADESYYQFKVLLENDGREKATVSGGELDVRDTGETLELSTNDSGGNNEQLEGNERREIYYSARGEVREDYDQNVEGMIHLDTTTGWVERQVTFEPSNFG